LADFEWRLALNTFEQRADGIRYSIDKGGVGGLNLLFILPAFGIHAAGILASRSAHLAFIFAPPNRRKPDGILFKSKDYPLARVTGNGSMPMFGARP